jgi:hypothetical protein
MNAYKKFCKKFCEKQSRLYCYKKRIIYHWRSTRISWRVGPCQEFLAYSGSAKANRREPKTCMGRVFHYKLDCFDDVHELIYVVARPHL